MDNKNILEYEFDTTELSRVKHIVKLIEDKLPEGIEDCSISFTFFMGALFPDILNNIKEAVTQSYIEGFKEGAKNVN